MTLLDVTSLRRFLYDKKERGASLVMFYICYNIFGKQPLYISKLFIKFTSRIRLRTLAGIAGPLILYMGLMALPCFSMLTGTNRAYICKSLIAGRS